MTEASTFLPSAAIGVGDPIIQVYTIVPPTCDRSYCQITKIEIIDATNDGVFQPGAAVMSSTCTASVCYDVDVFSSSLISMIKFRVKTTFHTSLKHISDTEVTIDVNCELSLNVMTNTFMDVERTFFLNHTVENKFFFKPFSCTFDPTCCTTINYVFSSEN